MSEISAIMHCTTPRKVLRQPKQNMLKGWLDQLRSEIEDLEEDK